MTNENLVHKPFTSTRLQEERDSDKYLTFSVKLNGTEQEVLKRLGKLLQQKKRSRIVKDCLTLVDEVIFSNDTKAILNVIVNNQRITMKGDRITMKCNDYKN